MRHLTLLALFACGSEPIDCPEETKFNVYVDEDGDGHGFGPPQLACTLEEGFARVADDCDDTEADVSPTSLEICDGNDNDCDGEIDDGLRQLTFYKDKDADGYGNLDRKRQACSAPEGFVENGYDCDDDDEFTYPNAVEFCDGRDNDCDTLIDDDDPTLTTEGTPTWFYDSDGDGYGTLDLFVQLCNQPPSTTDNADDCNDFDPLINPDAREICDGQDNDCDGYTDDSDDSLDPSARREWWADIDQDGYGDPDDSKITCVQPWFYTDNDLDCDDAEPLLGPPESGEWVLDVDGDGFGVGDVVGEPSCTPPGPDYALAVLPEDCDDGDPDINPDAVEVCNGVDDDCDDLVDDRDDDLDESTLETWFFDLDSDGYGDDENLILACDRIAGTVGVGGDCDDTLRLVNPDGIEICNDGIDDNCDGEADDADDDLDLSTVEIWWADLDTDGYGAAGSELEACDQPDSYVGNSDDCDDTDPFLGPPSRWALDLDEDGYPAGDPEGDETCFSPGAGYAPVSLGLDCRPADPESYPGATEICGDGIDQDCSGADIDCGPPSSCAEVQSLNPVAPSGVYTIEAADGGEYDVYCDLVTDGGGWTLVGSSTDVLSDERDDYSDQLSTISPSSTMDGIWWGMLHLASGDSDIRFACKDSPISGFMRVDLSFYDIHWYEEITTGEDFMSCFNEADGLGYDSPAPARRNNLTFEFLPEGDDWNAVGYLEGENACGTGQFTVDFDDRGVAGNPSDGTDWGMDERPKCATDGSGGAWFIFVRE
jgi:hypothetical protein